MNMEPSTIMKPLCDFAPKFVELTENVLFGDVWQRPELSPRERSLITIAALVTGGSTGPLPFHLDKARHNGLTEKEIIEELTHLAFYCGWPKALAAINVAKEVYEAQP